MRVGHYLDRIHAFNRGERVAPITINVDPTSRCNQKCEWCNSWRVRGGGTGGLDFDSTKLECLSRQLEGWGVQTCCIAGGGEPTMSPYLEETYQVCQKHNLAASLTTNGLNPLPLYVLKESGWVGFSIDSATPATYKRLKGVDGLEKALQNVKKAVDDKKTHNFGVELTFKYLIYPGNEGEIPLAYDLAVKLGVDAFHIRPVSWGSTRGGVAQPIDFSPLKDLPTVPTIPIRRVDYRFDPSPNDFPHCLSWMAATITTGGQVGFCSNQKGLMSTVVCDLPHFREEWTGAYHRSLLKLINPQTCPKCPYTLDVREMSQVGHTNVWI